MLKTAGEAQIRPFASILECFKGNEILVLNNTRVVPARLYGQKNTSGRVEVFFLEPLEPGYILAMTRGRIKPGQTVKLALGAEATLLSRDEHGRGRFKLDLDQKYRESTDVEQGLWAWLEEAGKLPLPPYIDRQADAQDIDRYQTVFAKEPGAVAAPTRAYISPKNYSSNSKQKVLKSPISPYMLDPVPFYRLKAMKLTIMSCTANAIVSP